MDQEIAPNFNQYSQRGTSPKGRAAATNISGRYEKETRVNCDENWDFDKEQDYNGELRHPLRTSITEEACQSIISHNQSPDLSFNLSINPYRGCEHGCIYCYARPSHSYHGLSPGLDFETKLFVKRDAAGTLLKEISKPRYKCETIVLGTNTDCYQPIERDHRVTRGLLETLSDCQHPVSIVTKSQLVTRDIDILKPMAEKNLANIFISITTLDRELARKMEPRATAPKKRLQTIDKLVRSKISVGVLISPIIPGLTDHELENILHAAKESGASSANYTLIRLPMEVKNLFQKWLRENTPERASRVTSLIRNTRAGRDNDPFYGSRMRGEGPLADLTANRFKLAIKRLKFDKEPRKLTTDLFCPPINQAKQLPLFK